MPDIDLHNMFRKRVSSSALPFNLWAYHLCQNFLLYCKSCLEELALGGTWGRPSCMLCPKGTLLLMMRLLTPLGMMIPSRVSFLLLHDVALAWLCVYSSFILWTLPHGGPIMYVYCGLLFDRPGHVCNFTVYVCNNAFC